MKCQQLKLELALKLTFVIGLAHSQKVIDVSGARRLCIEKDDVKLLAEVDDDFHNLRLLDVDDQEIFCGLQRRHVNLDALRGDDDLVL